MEQGQEREEAGIQGKTYPDDVQEVPLSTLLETLIGGMAVVVTSLFCWASWQRFRLYREERIRYLNEYEVNKWKSGL